jgi:hypothetical protein
MDGRYLPFNISYEFLNSEIPDTNEYFDSLYVDVKPSDAYAKNCKIIDPSFNKFPFPMG